MNTIAALAPPLDTGSTRSFARYKLFAISLLCLLAAGCFLRLPASLFNAGGPLESLQPLHPQSGFTAVGFDEHLYQSYVETLSTYGITSYPDIAQSYIDTQRRMPSAILPPTRFLYIWSATVWHDWTGTDALQSLKDVSSLFGILTLLLSAIIALRLGDERIALCVTALMVCAPIQIHMSQHALIDGVFAFFALLCLWLLWENLHAPNDWRWLVALGFALALLVLTKENALFAYIGLLVALGAAFYFQIGTTTRHLLAALLLGPLLGVAILVNLCGSLSNAINVYLLLVSKAAVLPYAIHTGDGPWYRYFVDLLLVSPFIFLCAAGAIFTLKRTEHAAIFLAAFIAGSFLIMCNVRYGMNLRYASMWDLPLRFLAAVWLVRIVSRFSRASLWLALIVAVLCLYDLRQYQIFFVRFGLYELVPEGLLRALQILK